MRGIGPKQEAEQGLPPMASAPPWGTGMTAGSAQQTGKPLGELNAINPTTKMNIPGKEGGDNGGVMLSPMTGRER